MGDNVNKNIIIFSCFVFSFSTLISMQFGEGPVNEQTVILYDKLRCSAIYSTHQKFECNMCGEEQINIFIDCPACEDVRLCLECFKICNALQQYSDKDNFIIKCPKCSKLCFIPVFVIDELKSEALRITVLDPRKKP